MEHTPYDPAVMWWQYLAWGACGGVVVEALELSRGARRAGGRLWRVPGEPDLAALIASVVVRLLLSMLVALAAGLSHQVNGPAGAVAVGIAAPLLLELLAAQVAAGWTGGWAARFGWVSRIGRAAPFSWAARLGRALRGARAGEPQQAPGETEPTETEPDQIELMVPEALVRVAGTPGAGGSRNGKAGSYGKAGRDGG